MRKYFKKIENNWLLAGFYPKPSVVKLIGCAKKGAPIAQRSGIQVEGFER